MIKSVQHKLDSFAEREDFGMKGKKFLVMLAAVLCCAMTTIVFTACSSDDIDNPDDYKPVDAMMNYELTVNDAILNVLDVTIEYYNAEGRVQTEAMTTNEWKKSVKAKLPVNLGARLKIQLKNGIDPTSFESLTFQSGYKYFGLAVSATEKEAGNWASNGNTQTYPVKGNELVEWVADHADNLVSFLYSFSSDGKATKSSW